MTEVRIYFIQVGQGGPVKIGITKGPVAERLRVLQAACPYELRVAAIIFDAHPVVESHLHGRFHSGRIRGEWFKGSTPGLRELIADINAGRLDEYIASIIAAQRGHEAPVDPSVAALSGRTAT